MLGGQNVWRAWANVWSWGQPPRPVGVFKADQAFGYGGAGDKGALRHGGIGTTLSQITIRTEAVTEIKVSEETMREAAH